jgi:hypothetical protein
MPCCQPVCLTWSDFPTGGGAPGLSFHVYPDIMLGVYSKAATCVRQTMYTADRAIPASPLFICTALPACHLSCMSNKLIFLIHADIRRADSQ